MRLRSQLPIALGAFLALILLAVAAGRGDRGSLTSDLRRSSVSPGPYGTRALAEVVEKSGGSVTRWRRRLTALDSTVQGALVLVVDPPRSLSMADGKALLNLTDSTASVMLAGNSADAVMACFGYGFDYTYVDSARVVVPSGASVSAVVAVFEADTATPPRPAEEDDVAVCPAFPVASVDTVLRTDSGAAVLVRIRRENSPHRLYLLSDAGLLGTSGLRLPEVAPLVVGIVRGASDHLVFDEFHHDAERVSMGQAALAWSRESPVGWMFWNLAIVSFLWFVFSGVRFGPVQRTIRRPRRSSLEHVRALATALAASNGHDAAISAIVRGLRRRLTRASGDHQGTRAGRDARAWADALADRVTQPAAREPVQSLVRLTRPGQSEQAVRTAANAVEDVWDALH